MMSDCDKYLIHSGLRKSPSPLSAWITPGVERCPEIISSEISSSSQNFSVSSTYPQPFVEQIRPLAISGICVDAIFEA